MACGILVPWSRIESVSPALEAWSLYHWTASKSYHSISTNVFWIPIISTSVVSLFGLPHLPPCAMNSSPVGNTLPCRGWGLNIIWACYEKKKKALHHFLSAMLGVRAGWHLFLSTVSQPRRWRWVSLLASVAVVLRRVEEEFSWKDDLESGPGILTPGSIPYIWQPLLTEGVELDNPWGPLCSDTQSWPTLWSSMDCGQPDSSVHGIFQGGIRKWVAISSSKDRTVSPVLQVDWLLLSHQRNPASR